MDLGRKFAEAATGIRNTLGLTQREMGELIGPRTTSNTVARWEKAWGGHTPAAKSAVRYATIAAADPALHEFLPLLGEVVEGLVGIPARSFVIAMLIGQDPDFDPQSLGRVGKPVSKLPKKYRQAR